MKQICLLLFVLLAHSTISAQTLSFENTLYDYEVLEFVDKAVTADLNGDQLPDFIVSWETQRKLYIGLNNQLSKPDFKVIDEGSQLVGLTAVDLDLDGDLDFVGAAPFEDASFWWENDGTANFTKQSLSIEDYNGIHFADLNGDGQLEAIISIDKGLHLYSVNGGDFTRQSTLFEDFFGDNSLAIQIFDNNGDGLMDIVATFDRNGVIIYQQVGNLVFDEIEVTGDLFNQSSIFPVDINQDEFMDFITYSSFEGSASMLLNNQDGTYTVSSIPKDLGRVEFIHVEDVDKDGDSDILYAEENSFGQPRMAALSILVNDKGEFTKLQLSDKYFGIQTGGMIDFDNDGDKDLFVFANSGFDDGYVVFENTTAISTAIHDNIFKSLNVFPTLITSFLKIDFNEPFTYKVMDADGKEMTVGEGDQETIVNCKDWQRGTYFIAVQKNNALISKKVIKLN